MMEGVTEFPIWYWHFDPVLNASVMTARATMRVYIFHGRQFHAPVMSPFFRPYKLFDDVTLDDIHPRFHLPRYLTDADSDFDTRLTPTYSVESDSDTRITLTYLMESDPSEPSYPSVIRLTSNSNSSSSSVVPGHAPPLVHGHEFIHTCAVPRRYGHTEGGECGDDPPGGFRNGYLLFNG